MLDITHIMCVKASRHQVCWWDNLHLKYHMLITSDTGKCIYLSRQKLVKVFPPLNVMLSLTEANTVNIILFEEHLHKICSWWLVAEDHHLEIGQLLLEFLLFQTLLPLLMSFSSASRRASVFLVGATRRNFWSYPGVNIFGSYS